MKSNNAIKCGSICLSVCLSVYKLICCKLFNLKNSLTGNKSAMTTRAAGFTLIELLAAVLIIGILAAVAIPQYRNAIDKTKLKEGLIYIKHIEQAENLYKLQYGDYTSNLDKLGLDLPPTISWTYSVASAGNPQRIDMINQQRTIWIEYNFISRSYKCNSKGSARMCLLSEVVKDCSQRIYAEWEYHCNRCTPRYNAKELQPWRIFF